MASVKSVRTRKSVDYKRLHEGDVLPRNIFNKSDSRVSVLPESFTVERVISRKDSPRVRPFCLSVYFFVCISVSVFLFLTLSFSLFLSFFHCIFYFIISLLRPVPLTFCLSLNWFNNCMLRSVTKVRINVPQKITMTVNFKNVTLKILNYISVSYVIKSCPYGPKLTNLRVIFW